MDTDMAEKSTPTIKFLCSYGGKILPRYPDGKLRYHGGETRVLAVDRFISFAELSVKLRDLCGASVNLRCQLPSEDIDALVSITSNEDLSNLVEEYDGDASLKIKIRAFLSKLCPSSPTSTGSSSSTATLDAVSPESPSSTPYSAKAAGGSFYGKCCPVNSWNQCSCQMIKPAGCPHYFHKSSGKLRYYYTHGKHSRIYLVHNGNHWQ